MQSAGQCILPHSALEMTSHVHGGDAPSFASLFQMSWGARGHLQSTLQEVVCFCWCFCCSSKPPFSVFSDWALNTKRILTDIC